MHQDGGVKTIPYPTRSWVARIVATLALVSGSFALAGTPGGEVGPEDPHSAPATSTPSASATPASTATPPVPEVAVARSKATPSPSPLADPSAPVVVHERTAFVVPGPLEGASAQMRARAASVILGRALEDSEFQVTLAPRVGTDNMQLQVNGAVVLDLAPSDAKLRDLPPPVYYETARAELATFLEREGRRAQLQQSVLAFSLIIFAGLILLLTIRFIRSRAADARDWTEKLARGQGLRIRELEVLSAQAVEGVLYILVGVGSLLLQAALVYGYLVYTLSRFAFSRGWVAPVNHVLFSPLAALARRIGGAIPSLVLLIVGFYVVRGALRLVGVYFSHVARGELRSPFGAPDVAVPARTIASAAVVVVAFLTLGPLTGDRGTSSLSLLAYLTLGAVALGMVPMMASAAVGLIVLFGRRIRPGEWVRVGTLVGEVAEISFVDITLVPPGSGRVRLPHLTLLFSAVEHLAEAPAIAICVPADPRVAPATVIALLVEAAKPNAAEVRLHSVSGDVASYRVSIKDAHPDALGPLWANALAALQGAGIGLSLTAALAQQVAVVASADPPV